MRLFSAWMALLASCLAGRPLHAQDTIPRLSLERALSIARQDNPALRSARQGIEVARGAKLEAEALPDPWIVWDFEEANGIAPGGFGEQRIGIAQFLEFPGKQGLRGDIGEVQMEIERRRVEVLEAFVLREVAARYYRAARAAAAAGILEENRELLQQFAEVTRSRYETNQAPYTDVVRTQLELARIQNDLISLRLEQRRERIGLNLLLGRPSHIPFRMSTEELEYRPFAEPLQRILERRLAASRTLQAAELRRGQRQTAVRLAGMSNLPDFGLGAFYQRINQGTSKGFFSAELSLSLPLWRKRQRGRSIAAQAELRTAEIELAALRDRVEGDIRQAYEEAELAAEQVGVFRTRLLGEAADALDAGISAYQYGEIDALELIDLYRTAKAVRLEYLDALQNYLVALARLEYSGEILSLD